MFFADFVGPFAWELGNTKAWGLWFAHFRICFRLSQCALYEYSCFSKMVVQLVYSSGAAGDSIRPQKRINATQFGKNWLQRDRGRASEIELINPLEGGNLPEDTSSTFKLYTVYS